MLENSSLRESLAGMEKQLVCLLNEKQANHRDQVPTYLLLVYVKFRRIRISNHKGGHWPFIMYVTM